MINIVLPHFILPRVAPVGRIFVYVFPNKQSINAYGPSSQVTLRNKDTQDDIYAALDSITTRESSSALVLIARDFNSKL